MDLAIPIFSGSFTTRAIASAILSISSSTIPLDVTAGVPYISTTLSTDVTADIKKKLGLQ
mgnify:CR=1 FL=1